MQTAEASPRGKAEGECIDLALAQWPHRESSFKVSMSEGVRERAARYSRQFGDACNSLQRFYERRQTLITVSATLASCLAAWWTYQSRSAHQRALEEQLRQIHADLEKSAYVRSSMLAADLQKSEELQKQAAAPTRLGYVLPGILGTFLLGYAAGFRHGKHGRVSMHMPGGRGPSHTKST